MGACMVFMVGAGIFTMVPDTLESNWLHVVSVGLIYGALTRSVFVVILYIRFGLRRLLGPSWYWEQMSGISGEKTITSNRRRMSWEMPANGLQQLEKRRSMEEEQRRSSLSAATSEPASTASDVVEDGSEADGGG